MKKSSSVEVSKKSSSNGEGEIKVEKKKKPLFRPAKDDTKPPLQDPVTSLSIPPPPPSLGLYIFRIQFSNFRPCFRVQYLDSDKWNKRTHVEVWMLNVKKKISEKCV